ncbi:hypothetical protein KUCAC02_032012 [Chaenocephalus aceratus]|nr:hypothetical protein KUCAC02_032012 [Chaenocephalus aceratus]
MSPGVCGLLIGGQDHLSHSEGIEVYLFASSSENRIRHRASSMGFEMSCFIRVNIISSPDDLRPGSEALVHMQLIL